MVKAILFDFWGTLMEQGVRSPIQHVKNALQIDLPFSEYVVRMERAMMTEQFSTLREAFLSVFAEFNLDPREDLLEELIGMWNKSWMLAKPYPETEAVLKELQKKYRLILISNTDSFSVEKVLGKLSWDKYFHKFYFSYQMHLLKTDQNFFQTIMDDLSLAPEDCLVVGDSIQSDVLAAAKSGVKAILLDRRNTREFSPKITTLTELETQL
ncbi:MAG TPA: HAD family hydrolase [Candidatus Nanoarchaeia archaeon]|nr:HAD family hydrolase [Candidatus Nanoarchaeia archaeon]